MKEYYVNNKEDIKEYKKQYRKITNNILKNTWKNTMKATKKILKSRRNNTAISAKKVSEPIECECGCTVTRGGLAKHRKSKKHVELMKDKLN